jgi:hypothetical protein
MKKKTETKVKRYKGWKERRKKQSKEKKRKKDGKIGRKKGKEECSTNQRCQANYVLCLEGR